MQRRRRVLAGALLGILALVVVAGGVVALLLLRELDPERASAHLSELLGREVRVDGVEVRAFPYPTLRGVGVRAEPAFTARAVAVTPSMAAALRGRLEVSRISFDEPELRIVREEDGDTLLGGGDGEGALPDPAALPEIFIREGRVSFRDETQTPIVEIELAIESLAFEEQLLGTARSLDARLALGPDGRLGLARVEARLEPWTGLEVSLRAIDAALLARHLPRDWPVGPASGVIDGSVQLALDEGELEGTLDLSLRGGGLTVAGVRAGGATGLRARVARDAAGALRVDDGLLEVEALGLDDHRATGLRAGFSWEDGRYRIHDLRVATVAAGIEAASALALPGSESVPVELRLVEAGELRLEGRMEMQAVPGDPERDGLPLRLPDLVARGSELEIVHDPGGEASVTRLRIERLELRDAAVGETARMELEATVVDEAPGEVEVRASLGPLTGLGDPFDQPFRLAVTLARVPAGALLPYVPEAWPIPERLGPVDLELAAHGDAGRLDGTATLRSRIGPRGESGELVVKAWARQEDAKRRPLAFDVELLDLDAAVLAAELRERFGIDELAGRIDASGLVEADANGEFEGEVEVTIRDCGLEVGPVRLERICRLRAEPTRLQGKLALGGVRLRAAGGSVLGVPGKDIEASGVVLPPALQFESASMLAYGGIVSGSGSLVARRPVRFDLHLEAKGLDLARVASRDAPPSDDPNLIDGWVDVAGSWTGEDNWIAPLDGSGEIDVRGGEAPGFGLRRALAGALLGLVPGSGLIASGEPPPTPLDHASFPFTLEEGRVRLEGIAVESGDYLVRGYGRISHDFTWRLEGDVRLTAEGIHNTLALTGAPRLTRMRVTLPAIPIVMRGALGDAEATRVGVDVANVPMDTARSLFSIPARAGSAVKGAARRGLDTLRGKER